MKTRRNEPPAVIACRRSCDDGECRVIIGGSLTAAAAALPHPMLLLQFFDFSPPFVTFATAFGRLLIKASRTPKQRPQRTNLHICINLSPPSLHLSLPLLVAVEPIGVVSFPPHSFPSLFLSLPTSISHALHSSSVLERRAIIKAISGLIVRRRRASETPRPIRLVVLIGRRRRR